MKLHLKKFLYQIGGYRNEYGTEIRTQLDRKT